ncbi:hypothetical protein B0H11DRAFT_2401870, partial [Mycena galericulata]
FPPELVTLGYYTTENAVNWLDIDKFMRWLSLAIQSSSVSLPSTPLHPAPSTTHAGQFRSAHAPQSSPAPPTSSPLYSSPSSIPTSFELKPSLPGPPQGPPSSDAILISSDSESESEAKNKRKKRKRTQIVKSDNRGDYAYLLDLSGDTREWLDKKGAQMSMVAIIKSEDQDAWGEGTGGSTSKPTNVVALGNIPCQVASHNCQGVFVCSQLDPSLLDGHERYEPDDEAMRELWEADRAVNVRDTSSRSIRAAAFYAEVQSNNCKFVKGDGSPCQGGAVYRKLRQMNFDGKLGFIGCQNYAVGQTHRFITINRDVDEDLLLELFQNKGQFKSHVNVPTDDCARVLPPRQGGRGNQKCPYTHIDTDGNVLEGKIIHRKCPTTIKIFAPLDRTDRRAIISLSTAHNHPRPPSTKVSRKGKDAYKEAIVAAGVTSLTVLKCDNGSYTSKIFGGNIPAAIDPALSNPRIKRKLIYDMKTVENPHGLGIEGVCFFQKKMAETLPADKRYIQHITSEDGVEVILTMLPFLARRIHTAKASLHDNTYSRVHGAWKEWEVVIFDDKLNFRTTITRIYSKHEAYEVFKKMWTALWDTIHRVTGVQVKFKFMHGEGLRTILVDGNKPQANALGADLVARNQPEISGISETDPKKILLFILRTCIFHVDRKFTEMAKVVPDEEMGRIRRCRYLKTQQEIDDFVAWCKNSQYKVVRDWVKDKDSIPWFWPSINEHLSKIPKEDWYLTPGDTNLNESAHPYTNQHTGTNLPLLVAIQTAYKLDLQVEEKIKLMEANCVLVNHRNTKSERDRNNAARRTSHHQQALERVTARDELEQIELALQKELEARKSSNELSKELREKKKALQLTSGVKKTK